MEQKTVADLSEILDRSHLNKWVAIAPDYRAVLASAETLSALLRQMEGRDVIFHRVLSRDLGFVPLAVAR